MKKFISLLVAVLCLTTANACMKKNVPVRESPLTILVMDSTQALLNGAQVKIGKQTYMTSFDGRIVLKPEQMTDMSVSVSCEGYESKKQALDDGSLAIITLTPKARNEGKRDCGDRYMTLGAIRGGVRYEKAVMAMATADYAVMEEEVAVPMSNNVSAGLLTAGEVNDFAKWQLWERYLQSTEAYQKTWGLVPRQRYTVQVMNKDGYPVVNYPVQIKDEKGNTIFQALTDDTGKAELWNGLMGERVNGLRVDSTLIVEEPCDAPEGVDVVFVFDATGSMGDELRYLQEEMKDVIARAKKATGGLAIRTGAVVYRDHGDEYLTRISRLTDDIATTQTFIDKQHANGGGDYPEAVPEALMAALNSAGWSDNARARIAFLILDAPCHEDSATLALLHEQILNAAAMGVRIVPVVCSGIDDSAEYLMRAMALMTNGTSFFLTDDSGIGNKHHKPTTDSLKVEHLNDMLVRAIVEFSKMPSCKDEGMNGLMGEGVNEDFLPNPFTSTDLEVDPTIPHGEGVHYLIDVSGKLLGVFEGDVPTDRLPIGVYFIKTYFDGIWHTKKILVR